MKYRFPKFNVRKIIFFFFKLCLALIPLIVLLVIYLDIKLETTLAKKRWKFPAVVYAAPETIYLGQKLTQQQIQDKLSALRYRSNTSVEQPGTYRLSSSKLTIFRRSFHFSDGLQPAVKVIVYLRQNIVERITDRFGSELAFIRLEALRIGGIYPQQAEDRIMTQLHETPPYLVETLLAVEDRYFFDHYGISLRAIIRAFVVNVRSGQIAQGGSTLTQQLIKNYYLTAEKSFFRKIIEAVMALLVERHLTKKEIIEAYLNEVYMGQSGSRSIHGFGMASYEFFARPINELELHQVALLVAMVKGPSYYHPRRNPQRAQVRRNSVLQLLANAELISTEQHQYATKQPLSVVAKGGTFANRYPAFMDLVKIQLKQDYQDDDLHQAGLRIFTTLDVTVQRQAERAITKRIEQLDRRGDKSKQLLQAAMVVLDPHSGNVQALIGGRRPRFPGFNRALHAKRPIGSLVKPVVYLAALEHPRVSYTLTTLLQDEPVSVSLTRGKSWQPQNFDRVSHGNIILQEALVHSYNLATVHLGLKVGLPRVRKLIKRLGVTAELPTAPALLLGAVTLSPLEVAKMYQTIAAHGFSSPIRAIKTVLDAQGQPLTRYPLEVEQVVSAEHIYLLQHALQQVMLRGTGKSAYYRLNQNIKLAGKTGTTNGLRDSWFSGMSHDYLAVVWVGRDDNKPTRLTGASGALQVWTDFMLQVQPKSLQLPIPKDVQQVLIEPTTGLLTKSHCEDKVWVVVRSSQIPEEYSECGRQLPFMRWWHGR